MAALSTWCGISARRDEAVVAREETRRGDGSFRAAVYPSVWPVGFPYTPYRPACPAPRCWTYGFLPPGAGFCRTMRSEFPDCGSPILAMRAGHCRASHEVGLVVVGFPKLP